MPSLPIPRLPIAERETFERDFLGRGRPVVLTGATSGWEARETLAPERLRATHAGAPVRVQVQPHLDRYVEMTLGELLDVLERPGRSELYLCEVPVADVAPELAEAAVVRGVVAPDRIQRAVLFAGRGAFSPLHFHDRYHALAAPVVGRKQFRLIAPDQTRHLYPRPWWAQRNNFTRIPFGLDGHHPEHGFPRAERAAVHECEIEPGDALFIPVHWWHDVRGPDLSVMVACAFDAPLRDWSFPTPGLRVLSGDLARRALGRLRTLRGARAAA